MPVVEAMACGTPVVTSTHPSLDDAAGDAAVRADPKSAEALASAIERALAERERARSRSGSSTRAGSRGALRRGRPRRLRAGPGPNRASRYRRLSPGAHACRHGSLPDEPARRAGARPGARAPALLVRRRRPCDAHPARHRLVPLRPARAGRRRDRVDLLHCPGLRAPLRASVPLVVTIHDVAVLREPESFNRWTRTYSATHAAAGRPGGEPNRRRLGVQRARGRRPSERAREQGAGDPVRRRAAVHAGRPPRRRVATSSPSPRSSRARTCGASSRPSPAPASPTTSCGWSAPAAGAA